MLHGNLLPRPPPAKRISGTRVLQTHVLGKIIENLTNSAARFGITKWIDHSINLRNLLRGKSFELLDSFSRWVQTLRHLGAVELHWTTVLQRWTVPSHPRTQKMVSKILFSSFFSWEFLVPIIKKPQRKVGHLPIARHLFREYQTRVV